MERKTGFEPATPTLARLCSTPELLPLAYLLYHFYQLCADSALKMAELTGLEPATSGVTGRRSNQLSYSSTLVALLVGGIGFEPTTPCV